MARRHPPLGQRTAQIDGLHLAVTLAEQLGLQQIEKRKLFVAAERSWSAISSAVLTKL